MSTDLMFKNISPEVLEQTKLMKVLVVDDSRTLRRLLIRELMLALPILLKLAMVTKR